MSESKNRPSEVPEGFSAVSLHEQRQIQGGSRRAAMFEFLKAIIEKYNATANEVIRNIGR